MSKDLEKFFNLITEAKQRRNEPKNDTEKLLNKNQFHIKVKATELKDFFTALEDEKNKLLEQKQKDKEKLQELEEILFSKLPSPRKTIKEEKPVVKNLSGPKKPEPEETNLESIREAVMQANQALLIKEDEPEDLVNQSAGEITTPTIGSDEKATEIEINTEDVIKELSKISTNTGVILNKDIDSVKQSETLAPQKKNMDQYLSHKSAFQKLEQRKIDNLRKSIQNEKQIQRNEKKNIPKNFPSLETKLKQTTYRKSKSINF